MDDAIIASYSGPLVRGVKEGGGGEKCHAAILIKLVLAISMYNNFYVICCSLNSSYVHVKLISSPR